MIDAYFIDVRVPEEVIAALETLLTTSEQERAARYRFDDDRRRSIVARAATRRILSRSTGIPPCDVRIVTGQHGKPELEGAGIRFNASHSGDLVAVAFADRAAVGIDVERHRTLHDPLGIARRFFSEREQAFLRDADDIHDAFFTVWTAKEAIVKASGEGIAASDLRSFTVPFGNLSLTPVTNAWSVAAIEPPFDGYHASIATAQGSTEPIISRVVEASSLV